MIRSTSFVSQPRATVRIRPTISASWWFRGTYLPELPPSEPERRQDVLLATRNLLWIAGAVVYVVVSVLILPKPPPLIEPQTKDRKRIDFRTFGR